MFTFTGSLCTRLSADASKVQGATGARIGSVLQVSFLCHTENCADFWNGYKVEIYSVRSKQH